MNNDGKLPSFEKIYIYVCVCFPHPSENCQKTCGTNFKIREGSKLGNGTHFLARCVLALKAITRRTPKNIINDSNIK